MKSGDTRCDRDPFHSVDSCKVVGFFLSRCFLNGGGLAKVLLMGSVGEGGRGDTAWDRTWRTTDRDVMGMRL